MAYHIWFCDYKIQHLDFFSLKCYKYKQPYLLGRDETMCNTCAAHAKKPAGKGTKKAAPKKKK